MYIDGVYRYVCACVCVYVYFVTISNLINVTARGAIKRLFPWKINNSIN